MPIPTTTSPLKRPTAGGRFRRLLASLRPPASAGPLPVQTGFPTSLADLVVKNHGRLKKPARKRHHRRPPRSRRPSPPKGGSFRRLMTRRGRRRRPAAKAASGQSSSPSSESWRWRCW
ncbi:unnamed protein product [Urochloa humidicola]